MGDIDKNKFEEGKEVIILMPLYFLEEGIWPFSGNVETPVVIGSYNLITDLYPGSRSGKEIFP